MENFHQLQELGRGSFGVVLLAERKEDRAQVAIKQVAINTANIDHQAKYLTREVINHSLLRHPHIVHFDSVFRTSTHVCIVMEYANSGRLYDLIYRERKLAECVARWYFQQLILALDFAHKRGVANRDIKLENLLLHQTGTLPWPMLKMCDFGYSRSDHDTTARSRAGTPTYMAPEVIAAPPPEPGAPPPPAYDAARADVWSCGVVLYAMLFGRYPFDEADDEQLQVGPRLRAMRKRMEQQAFATDYPGIAVSDECKELLRGLLQPDPNKRLTLAQIMEHRWFEEGLPAKAHEQNEECLSRAPPEQPTRELVGRLMGEVMQASLGSGRRAQVVV